MQHKIFNFYGVKTSESLLLLCKSCYRNLTEKNNRKTVTSKCPILLPTQMTLQITPLQHYLAIVSNRLSNVKYTIRDYHVNISVDSSQNSYNFFLDSPDD